MVAFALVGLINFLLGAGALYVVQCFVLRKGQEKSAESPVAVSPPAPSPKAPEAPARQASAWLATLMEKVEGDISRAAFEIDELAEELNSVPPDDPASIMAAAAAMLVANRRLQSDLTTAQAEIQEQRQKVDALAAESRTDTLTGLANRRSFDEELGRRFDQWRRHKVPVSLLLVDIDRFKQINDRYGHPIGDAALKWVARLQSGALRQMDVAARYGGEEFGLILPGTKLSDAGNVAERLRATIAAKAFREGEHEFPITVSIGVAMSTEGDEPAVLIKRADEALYAAKQNGRDRAFMHNGSEAVAIQADKSLVRHPFDSMQQVASYHGGGIPPASAFNPMRSSDISAKGISFISESAPDCKAFVVRLGAGAQLRYMVANIANVTALSQGESPQYRIGCAFVARLEADDVPADDEIGENAAAPELVAC
ncbi:MAG TPA: GGDEF domain-containing protein [Pirellulales bacterium]|nr:GGDEF domain-containing protein [Pirellulales bacterium]